MEGGGMTAAEAFQKMEEERESMTTAPTETGGAQEVATESGVGLVWACDVVPEPISWLWEGWIAAGKLHILAGIAGTGKTTLAMSLVATVSRGGTFPDGSRCGVPGRVLIWTGEDDPKDTLVPRLHAVGADLEKVAFVETVRKAGEDRSFDPATDLPLLSEAVGRLRDVRLVLVDSIVSAVTGDSHQNTEVRRSLQPFVDIGKRFGCAVLGITHFSKGTGGGKPLERVTGSVAFGALARVVLVASKHEKAAEGESSCIFARAKSNIGKDYGGFGYDLEEVTLEAYPEIKASRVRWGTSLDGTAAEILDAAEGGGSDGGALSEAIAFLREELAGGPLAPKEIEQRAKEAGIQSRTLRRARESLGIKPGTPKVEGVRYAWSLPPEPPVPSCWGDVDHDDHD